MLSEEASRQFFEFMRKRSDEKGQPIHGISRETSFFRDGQPFSLVQFVFPLQVYLFTEQGELLATCIPAPCSAIRKCAWPWATGFQQKDRKKPAGPEQP